MPNLWPFRRRRIRITRPLRDEEALNLVKRGVLRPSDAPLAVLRDMQRKEMQR